jgi:hypothetical protein
MLIVSVSPLAYQVVGGYGPIWEFEFETSIEQSAGDSPAALENQLGLGAHEECANLNE